jgi:hypothetical protein
LKFLIIYLVGANARDIISPFALSRVRVRARIKAKAKAKTGARVRL